MAKESYTCFVISPIGNKMGDAEQQKKYEHFSNVLEFLIMPALRFAEFQQENIVRSDKESRVGRISETIMSHLKQDDLCPNIQMQLLQRQIVLVRSFLP